MEQEITNEEQHFVDHAQRIARIINSSEDGLNYINGPIYTAHEAKNTYNGDQDD